MTKIQFQVEFYQAFIKLISCPGIQLLKRMLNHKKVLDHTGQFRASLNFKLWCINHTELWVLYQYWLYFKTWFPFLFIFNFSYSYVRVEEYINQEFNGSDVKIEVIKGQTVFEDMYPCLAAVNRCASVVPRHDGRVIWLTYEPEGRKPFISKTMKISLNHGVVILKNSLHSYSMRSFPDDHSVIWRNIFLSNHRVVILKNFLQVL